MNPIFARTSVRKWTKDPIEEEKILEMLKAGMASPSAMNARDWRFIVVENPQTIQALSGISPYSAFAACAPLMIAVISTGVSPCPEYGQIDAGICIENILLEAAALQLGAVCLGVMPEEDRMAQAGSILQLKEGELCAALIPAGYPLQEPKPRSNWQPEKIEWIR